jgi:hypothetical protein
VIDFITLSVIDGLAGQVQRLVELSVVVGRWWWQEGASWWREADGLMLNWFEAMV